MGKMTAEVRQEIVKERYSTSDRRSKIRLLDEFTALTGYHRKHAIRVLSGRSSPTRVGPRTSRPRLCDEAVRAALIVLWEASDRICGKRLKPLLPVERAIRFLRTSFFAARTVTDLERLNQQVLDWCKRSQQRRWPQDRQRTVGGALAQERARLHELTVFWQDDRDRGGRIGSHGSLVASGLPESFSRCGRSAARAAYRRGTRPRPWTPGEGPVR